MRRNWLAGAAVTAGTISVPVTALTRTPPAATPSGQQKTAKPAKAAPPTPNLAAPARLDPTGDAVSSRCPVVDGSSHRCRLVVSAAGIHPRVAWPGLVGSSHGAILWSRACHTFPSPGLAALGARGAARPPLSVAG